MLKIKWTLQADEKYLETLQFWIDYNKSTNYSEKIIDEIEYKESILVNNTFMGSIVEHTGKKVRRVLILNNYSLFYRINENEIEIISFWGNKMNPEDLKF